MRYIYLKPVKTDEDKKRVRGLPKMSGEELSKLIKDKVETKVITEATRQSSKKQNLDFRKMIVEDISKTLSEKGHLLSKVITKDLKPKKSTPKFKDGSSAFLLNNLESQATDLFYIKKIRENKANDIKLYNQVHSEVGKLISKAPKAIKDSFSALPASLTLSSSRLYQNIEALANIGLKLTWPVETTTYDPVNPGPETGEGNKKDQSNTCSANALTPNPKGFIRNVNWPLKPHLTSVKNQANRGTCSAFGAIAAVESRISVKYGVKVNLSEQDLYKKQKLDWNPNIFDDYYDDGYFPPISMLFQMASGYVFPRESAWEYNPSLNRVGDDNLRKYTHSCDNYSGACSDTNHQSHKHCYSMDIKETKKVVSEVCEWVEGIPLIGQLAGWACHTVTDWVTEVVGTVEVCVYDTNIAGNSRFKLSDFGLIWDPIWQNDISFAKLALSLRKPMIFCFTVPDSFNSSRHSAADGKGYVVYDPNEATPDNAGGHCVEMVGFMDNNMIPAGLKISNGAGGGYFIIKNSWGKCWGDVGYAYLPYSWVNKWGTSMVVINDVQRI